MTDEAKIALIWHILCDYSGHDRETQKQDAHVYMSVIYSIVDFGMPEDTES